MAWDTGTIASATPHTALSTKIKALFGGSGVANWSFVENIPAGTGAAQSGSTSYSVDVYKCAGSGTDANDAGTDFYIALRIPVSDGAVASAFDACEDYNPISAGANKATFRRQTANTSLNTTPIGSGSWRNDTLANEATIANAAITTSTLNTSGFTYYIKLTKNFLLWAIRVGVTEGMHIAGLMDTFVVNTTDSCPLFAAGPTAAHAGVSRLPGVITSNTDQWRVNSLFWTRGPNLGTDNSTNNNDIWQSNKIHVSRILIVNKAAATLWFQSGGLRGLIKSDVLSFKTGGTVQLGDTMVISGNTWTVVGTSVVFNSGDTMHVIVRAN
jgi:hypothetical protein